MEKITTWLWFDTEAEEAAQFYTSIFPDSRITDVSHYGEAGPREAGSVMTVSFELLGHTFVGLNGGPGHKIGGVGISFMVCVRIAGGSRQRTGRGLRTVVRRSRAAGSPTAYGVAWQIIPTRLRELLSDPDRDKAQRVMASMLQMKKIEIAELERAAAAAYASAVCSARGAREERGT